ncbi:MAG: hypothetical protein V1817_02570, partial [Candidatus Micrarchaeota archaeon]
AQSTSFIISKAAREANAIDKLIKSKSPAAEKKAETKEENKEEKKEEVKPAEEAKPVEPAPAV